MNRLLPLLLVLLLSTGAQAAEREAQRRNLCAQDLPDGAHLSAAQDCPSAPAQKTSQGGGFRDLGNGVSVRIGGRAAAEYGVSR